MNSVKEVLKKNTMLFILLIVALFFGWKTNGVLFDSQNVTNLIAQNGHVVILAVGMLMCILTGGNIDLSVGSVVAFIGAVAGKLMVTYKMNFGLVIVICLVLGILIGMWQGFWIAYIRIPSFIVTLAGMLLWRGVALIILDGLTISPFPDAFKMIFNSYIANPFGGSINVTCMLAAVLACLAYLFVFINSRRNRQKKGYAVDRLAPSAGKAAVICLVILLAAYRMAQFQGLPTILVILAIVVGVYTYYTSKTVGGRYLYAVGGNEKAAKMSGVNTNRVLFFAFTNMAFLSAVAALVCVARFNSAAPTAGKNYEMDAIASCYIGGASAYGGTGTVMGAVIGAVFMGLLNNGMSIMGVDSNWQQAIKGLVLLAAVAFDVISKKKSR
ncbi:sugar ABC transporter permease [Lachnospiraceae bacterium]|uniref:multiple monosaccharide ABC transporter permease n=1 Tax=Extibacter sp. GGCC_0201 TaxID=2731209 RepID=UPI002ED50C6F|nr:sugar ABC transporter permease [Lachnospiraceae bacterium]BDF36292.1 sugar ABC transporter permease [Lachnospiraceae bacterium]